jgi:hypothetical protein
MRREDAKKVGGIDHSMNEDEAPFFSM